MTREITTEELRHMAQRAGLNLDDGELRRLLPGVNRAKKQTCELRELFTAEHATPGSRDIRSLRLH